MRLYIFKRVIAFIPALFVLIVFSFILLKASPGDPIQMMRNHLGNELESGSQMSERTESELRAKLGLDLPVFYIGFSDTKKVFPKVHFNSDNQFHRWFFGSETSRGIIHGDFGKSFQSNESVLSIIKKKIGWSLLLSFLSIFISFVVVVPIGLKLGTKVGTKVDRRSTFLFTVLYSLPGFWVAMILLFLFCNPDLLNILPVSGVAPTGGFNADIGFFEKIFRTIPYLILPTLTFTYSSFAFISGNTKMNIQEILQKDFIRTARAKGASEDQVLYKHALPNALLQLITIFSHVFPYIIGGSVILETVFNIPGMGNTIFQAISSQDYPIVIAVFFFTGLITMIGFLISDILYALADPRIKYTAR